MPTLTVDLAELDLDTADAAGWVEAVDSLGNPLPVVSIAGDTLAFAARALEFSLGGVATIDLPSTATLTDGALYRVYVTRAGASTVPTAIGPFELTVSAALHTLDVLPPADVVGLVEDIRDTAVAEVELVKDQAVVARTAAESARDDAQAAAGSAAVEAATGANAAIAPAVSAAQSARAGAEAARAAAEALVISDLGTTDGQTRALIEAPASQTAQALSATIGTAVNAPKVFRLDTFNGFFEGETSADNPAIWDNSTHLNDAGLTDWAEWIVATAAAAGAFAKPNPKVVWLGDSWIYQGRVSILAAATTAVIPGATVVVSGVPGDTSTALLARFDADVPADADVVIFNEPGVNDAAGANLSVAAQLANLAELVRQIRALGATPVFTGHVPLADYPRAAPMNAALGRVIGDGTAFPGTDAQGSWTANVTQPRPDALGLGPDALAALTEGSQVYAIGQNAAAQLATASHVVAIGGAALYSLTTGGENTAIGGNAGFNATTGTGNTFIGKGAGFTTTTGSEQVAIGYNAVCLPAAAAATAIGTASEAGNYLATAVGAYTKALHIGSVAIGVDNTYAGATTTANNDFVLGTANHRYRMPGLPTAAPAAASGILWNDGGVVKVA